MLRIDHILLTQYKNYIFRSFDFKGRITGITGANGSGKTNLLDAIHYLCFTKSYFSSSDNQVVNQESQGMRIEGKLEKAGNLYTLVAILRENNKKEFSVNNELYKKLSAHIGKFPCVMIAPDDTELITGGSEERRKFIDTIISQLSSDYLQNLIAYNKILQQRNSLLKTAGEQRTLDEELLNILDSQLCEKGTAVFEERKKFVSAFLPLVQKEYLLIAGIDDNVNCLYSSKLQHQPLPEILVQNRQRDIIMQRTCQGPHRDDLEISMNGQPFKNTASQGQRKSFLFALKLAEYAMLKQHNGFAPLLLLDDIFEKLDAERMHNLLHKVCIEENGQIFITDTHFERLQEAFNQLGIDGQIIRL